METVCHPIVREVFDFVRQADPRSHQVYDPVPQRFRIVGRATEKMLRYHIALSFAEASYQGVVTLYEQQWLYEVNKIDFGLIEDLSRQIARTIVIRDAVNFIYVQSVYYEFPQCIGKHWCLISPGNIVVPTLY